MKENNIFDGLESGFDDISDETIIVDTGINPENVRRMVMEEISGKKKKRFSKKIVIGLIAAALSVGVLTTGAVASGSFNATFAEWFSGDCELGLYSGGNVYANSSSEDFDVNVLGVAGDDDEAYVAIEITRKDGKSFDMSKNNGIDFEDADCSVSMPWFKHDSGGTRGWEFYFKNDKTIQGNICFERGENTLKGQHFTGKFDKLKVFEYEDIKECDYMEYSDEYNKEIKELTEKYKDKLSDNSYISSYYTKENGSKYAITKETKYDVCFDISLNLNYKSSTKECGVESDSAKSTMGKFSISSARASAISVRLLSNDHSEYNGADSLDEEMNGKVYIKDSNVYDIEIQGSSQSVVGYPDGATYSETTLEGIYKKDGERVVINPDDIEKIEFGGAVLTVK